MGDCGVLRKIDGMTLIEIMVATGIMGILMMAMITMQTNQMKSNNYLEFQLNRTKLQGSIIGQFLNDPNNCRCLFSGAADFPLAGTPVLTGMPPPNRIGRYSYVLPVNCSTATMTRPFVTSIPNSDGLSLNNIELRNIILISGQYSGQLVLDVKTSKSVLGPERIPISIPVAITTVPGTPGNARFLSCQTAGSGSRPRCRVALQTFNNDNCTGGQVVSYTSWSDSVAPGATAWNVGSTGIPGSRAGMNWTGGDIACMRAGIECE